MRSFLACRSSHRRQPALFPERWSILAERLFRGHGSATNEATGESRSALTSETGNFSFPSLLPATYTIRVELAGFQTFQKTGNILTPNSRLDVGELKLAIGAVGRR